MEQQCYCSNAAALRTALNLKSQLDHNVTFDWKELVQGLAQLQPMDNTQFPISQEPMKTEGEQPLDDSANHCTKLTKVCQSKPFVCKMTPDVGKARKAAALGYDKVGL